MLNFLYNTGSQLVQYVTNTWNGVEPERYASANERLLNEARALTVIDTSRFSDNVVVSRVTNAPDMRAPANMNRLNVVLLHLEPIYKRLLDVTVEKILQKMDLAHKIIGEDFQKMFDELESVRGSRDALKVAFKLWSMSRKIPKKWSQGFEQINDSLNYEILKEAQTTRDLARLSLSSNFGAPMSSEYFEAAFNVLDNFLISEVKRHLTRTFSNGTVVNESCKESNGTRYEETETIEHSEQPYIPNRHIKKIFGKYLNGSECHIFQQKKSTSKKSVMQSIGSLETCTEKCKSSILLAVDYSNLNADR